MDADTPANNKIYINGADNTDAGSAGSVSSLSLAYDADWGIGSILFGVGMHLAELLKDI
ncbi:unnamed protein product [marine sediment metagenome]|uniref:Uncharacterized protein n=1 Tax=marine sediment metagenome TaxID=412755 RepID=X1D4F9_9ZZZZ